ncbi:hypothetical protein BsWGS_03271 [Bradybaena similaris]
MTMFRRKQDVDKHVASILSRKRDEKERQAQGFQIARLYYDIKEYSVAKRYLSGFLQVRENVPMAHQLMGEINEALGEEDEAIENYKRALNLGSYGSSNKQLVLKICELYCEQGTDLERMKYWCDQCEKFYPKSDILVRLKTKINKASNGQNVENSKEMEELVASELVNHPTDLKLRIKLLDLYIDSQKYEEAYDAAISTDLTTAFMDRLSWFEHLDTVFQEYASKFPDAKSDLVYNQHLLHVLRNIAYLGLGSREIDDCVHNLQRFDEQVKASVSLACQEEEWLAMLREMKGQMLFLAGLVLLKRAQTGTVGWQEACQLCGACFLASRSIDPIDPQASWFVRAPQGRLKFNNWWSLQSYDRLSQVGHMLRQFSQNDFLHWSRDIRQKFMTAKGHQTVFTVLYKPQNLQSQGECSFFYQATEMVEGVDTKEPVTERLMLDIDRVASQVHTGNLRHLVWLCLQRYSYDKNVQPNYHFNILDNIQYATKNVESGAAESLCQLDIQVFLLATVQCAASAIAERSTEYEEKKGRPSLLPVCLSRPLCTHDQEEWWSATHKFCTNSVKDDYSRLRRILIRGLETVRLIGPHGVSVSLITHIARSLDAKIKSFKQAEYGARCPLNDLVALENRAVFYWEKAKQALQRLQRNHHTPVPKNRLFKETGDMELPPRLVDKYMAEANFAIAHAAMRDGKFETALEGFESHQSVWAKFYCAQIYKALAERETDSDDQDSTDKRQALVFKSRDYLFDVMDMLDGDKGHELNSLVSRELEDLEMRIHDLELYNARNSTFRSTPARSSAATKSSSTTNGVGLGHSTPRYPLIASVSYASNGLIEEESETDINQSLRDQSLTSEGPSRPRPSPERLDLQIKSMSYSQASLFKMVMDRNEELIIINGKIMEELHQLKAVVSENKNLMEELKSFLGDNRDMKQIKSFLGDMMKQIKTELDSLKSSLVPSAPAQVSPATPLFVSHIPTPAAPRGPFPAFAPQPPVVPMAYGNYAMNSSVPAPPGAPAPPYCPTGLPGMRSSNVGKYRPQSEDDEEDEEDLSNIDETSAMFRDFIDAEQSYTQYFSSEAQMLDLSHGARSGIEAQPPLPVPPFQPRMSIPAGYFASALRGQTLQYAAAAQTPGLVKPTTPGPGFFSTPPVAAIGPAGAVPSAGLRMPVALAPATPLLAAAAPPVSVDSAQSPALIAALTGTAVPNVTPVTAAVSQGPTASVLNTAAALPAATPRIFGNFSATSTPITTTTTKTSLFGLSATTEPGKFSFGGLTFSSAPTIEAGKEQDKLAAEAQKPQPATTKVETAKPFAGFSLTANTATTKSDVKFLPQSTLSTAKTATPEKTLSPLAEPKVQGAAHKLFGSVVKSPTGGEQDHVEEYEPNVDFKPVIALPELVEKKTGEENEIEVFVERCRLFRFDSDIKQWKERGVGELKILQSKDVLKFRIVMRREQILKLCANHFLTADMKLTPMASSDRAWCYFANDFSEEEIKYEHLAVRFRTAEKAKAFQEAFDACCRQLKSETAVTSTTTIGDSRVGQSATESGREAQHTGDTGDKFNVSSSSDSRSLSSIFKPKAGSWECGGCLVRNNEEVLKCVACGAAKPGSQSVAASKPGSQVTTAAPSLSEMFKPKAGSWECGGCLVRNHEEVLKCLACGAAKPGSQATAAAKPGSQPPAVATPSLSELFKPKAGSWECDGCLVRNNADVVKCVACGTIKPGAEADAAAAEKSSSLFPFSSKAGPAETGFKFGAAAATSAQPTTGGFVFKAPAVTTSSTATFKFGMATTTEATTVPPTSGFIFKAPTFTSPTSATSTTAPTTSYGGFVFKPTAPATPATTATSLTTTASTFKPGFTIGASTPAATTSTIATTTTSASGFNLGAGFVFSPAGKTAQGPPASGGLLAKLLTSDESAVEKAKPAAGFNFSMLSKTPTAFGAADTSTSAATTPGTKGFQFSFTKTPPKAQTPVVVPGSPEVDEHGLYVNKEGDDSHIHFEPVVKLPEKVEVKTGEEDEAILFESRGKLYRFVSGEWKEKGVGVIKILQHRDTKKTRILMRRDQVLKICCNHIIEPSLSLQPMAKSEGKAWVWYALDFSEDDGKMEQLAVRFRTVEIASDFKKVFDQCRDSSGSTLQKVGSPARQAAGDSLTARKELFNNTLDADSSESDDVIFVGEDKPTEDQVAAARKYKLPDHFYLYEKKPPCPGCIGCEDGELPTGLSPANRTTDRGADNPPAKEPTKETGKGVKEIPKVPEQPAQDAHIFGATRNLPDFASLTSDGPSDKSSEGFVFGSGTSIDFSSLASSGKSSSFSWNTSTSSGPFKFAGAGQKLFGGGAAATTGRGDDEADGDDSGVVPSDDIHFEPVIPLPELVKVKTGEEDWTPLFCHRAKLYKFDKQLSQWKERGVGDIKILCHNTKPMFRVLQRREQVLKVSCNHLITADMELKPLATSETSWCWIANDLTESEPSVEKFAVKFKTKETAEDFKTTFENCQEKLRQLSTDQLKEEREERSQQHEDSSVEQQPQESLVHQLQGFLVQQQSESAYREEEGDDDYEEEEEEEEDDEEDDDDGTEVIFEKRVTLNVFEDGQWKKLGVGNLQLTYNDDLNGNNVHFIGDDNIRKCSHVICREHSIKLDQKNCEWQPIDFATDEPLRKHFMASFSSAAAAEEFATLFTEGQRLAMDSEISENLPSDVPVIFSSGESVHKG